MKKVILSKKAPAPIGPYSQGISFDKLYFFSGQVSINPENNEFINGDIKTQAELVMKNISALLSEAGLTFENILKTTIFLTDMKNFAEVNEIYAKNFKKDPPARSTVAVAGLPKGALVEIEVTAAKG